MNEYTSTIEAARGRTLAKGVAIVSEFVNRLVKYVPPDAEWNFNRWSAPERTLVKGGNCLDLAVLKMDMLIRAGFSKDDIFIARTNDHAVLLFMYPARRWCFSKPVKSEWIADINPPYFYKLKKSKLVLKDESPFNWNEVQNYIKFDKQTYFKHESEGVA